MLVSTIERNKVSEFVSKLDGDFEVVFTKRTTGELRQMRVRNLTESDVNGKGANYSLVEKKLIAIVDREVEDEGGRAVKSFGIPEVKLFIVDGKFVLVYDKK
jgi:hypothetical protein